MKRYSTLDVTSSDQLKVKRRTIIQTRKTLSQQNENDDEEVEILAVHHITIKELDEEEPFEDKVHDAPTALEDGGQVTVDELKELNLGTNEDPRPIFVSALMYHNEDESYYQLLLEHKDVFAWTYKEMPGLDPKDAVHHLAVKPGTRPIKQTQHCFSPELLSQIEAEIDKSRSLIFHGWFIWIQSNKNVARGRNTHSLPHSKRNLLLQGDAIWPQERRVLRAVQKIFGDMLHKNVECYVDDLVIKSKKIEDHLKDLRTVFNRLRKYQLKMNSLKCAFGNTSGKFLGFIVKHRGIEVNQTKIKVIRDMPDPRNLCELKSLQGRLALIRQFISNLAGRCQPFSRLMKKDVPFVWVEACHNAFESVKKYLSSSPLLGAPIPGKPLILYIATQERSIGALLVQENESHKEHALYYLSQTLTGPKLNYTPYRRRVLHLFLLSKRHLTKWALLLNQYEIIYTLAKVVKGQAVADFLADHPIPADWEISDDLPDEEVFFTDVSLTWMMFFDGSARKDEAGALIMSLQMVVEMKISSLEIYGDSMLVINQLLTHYERFDFVMLERVPRKDNQMADALANLADMLALTKYEAMNLPVCQR
ncbi:hypothetical protein L3X38_033552 [Prunus dulcis]|uniref:Reverse transcriptase domain-containing protein n=1 Tax=Prunus dulcis TaxID=3755 RepID=A0AAD4VG42_PRUDU|nr:hypothetical protein L3X38_033552 [Prunus dulcis]